MSEKKVQPYRLGHPYAEHIIDVAKGKSDTPYTIKILAHAKHCADCRRIIIRELSKRVKAVLDAYPDSTEYRNMVLENEKNVRDLLGLPKIQNLRDIIEPIAWEPEKI